MGRSFLVAVAGARHKKRNLGRNKLKHEANQVINHYLSKRVSDRLNALATIIIELCRSYWAITEKYVLTYATCLEIV